jgi:hypothetical protein
VTLLVLGLVESNLDQFVVEQGLIGRSDNTIGHSLVANMHQGIEAVGKAAEALALLGGE